jgi:hypothetical protein
MDTRKAETGSQQVNARPDSDAPQEGLYPYRFSKLSEGDYDPTLKKTVEWLIDSDDEFIVYIDEKGYVEWNMNDNKILGEGTGEHLNKIAFLESFDTGKLSSDQREVYARMLGEAVARLFQKDLEAAKGALVAAEEWIIARTTEIARRWYLEGAAWASLLAAIAAVFFVFGGDLIPAGVGPMGSPKHTVLLGACAGGLGAWLSVMIQRGRLTALDITAGAWMHYLEGIFRIMIGVLGALIVALAIKANIIGHVQQLSASLLLCMVAGFSERLVPSLIEQIESRSRASGSGGDQGKAGVPPKAKIPNKGE